MDDTDDTDDTDGVDDMDKLDGVDRMDGLNRVDTDEAGAPGAARGPRAVASAAAPPDALEPLPSAVWQVRHELPLAALDAGQPELTRLQMQVLANRGIQGAEAAHAYLGQGWAGGVPGLSGLPEAVALLCAAREAGLAVTVYGDFDADGMTSCAVMALGLRAAGISAATHIPQRDADGRGLNLTDVEALAAQGTQLIVTTDCGISNVAEVECAHALGLRVLVTDHHPPHGAIAPADATVNPRHPLCDTPEQDLAGVGVAFRVVEALLRALHGGAATPTLEALLDLVAVGTIGDVVPLTPVNWALVHAGLRRLNEQPRPGLRALLRAAGLVPGTLTERDISFALAPRLNAASRMGQPGLALELLLTDDPKRADWLARQVQALNTQRQELSDRMQSEARAQVAEQRAPEGGAAPALVVAQGEDWSLGIIGLVAGRLAEDYRRPAAAISLQGEECRGSMRAPAGYNLVEALSRRADLLVRFGGHAQAAGFTVRREHLPALLAFLREALRAGPIPAGATPPPVADGTPDPPAILPIDAEDDPAAAPDDLAGETTGERLVVDCRLPLRSAGYESYEALRRLAPFGPGFPAPLFVAQGVRVARCWRSGPGGRTLRLVLRDGPHERLALWSRQGASWPLVRALRRVDVVYHLELFARPDAPPEYVLRVEALRPAAD